MARYVRNFNLSDLSKDAVAKVSPRFAEIANSYCDHVFKLEWFIHPETKRARGHGIVVERNGKQLLFAAPFVTEEERAAGHRMATLAFDLKFRG